MWKPCTPLTQPSGQGGLACLHGDPPVQTALEGGPSPQPGHQSQKHKLTSVDKPPRSTFTELLGLVGQGDFNDSRNVPWRGLHPDGVGSDELQKPHVNRLSEALAGEGRHLSGGIQLPK